MMLDILRQKYADNEPIYLEDAITAMNVSSSYGRTLMAKWVKEGKIRRFDRGIYYFPKVSPIYAKVSWKQIKDNIDAYPTKVSRELIKMELNYRLYFVPRPLPDTFIYPFPTNDFRSSTVLFLPKPTASETVELDISRPFSSW